MSNSSSVIILPLSDCVEQLPQLARWHHSEWGFLRPGDRLQDRTQRLEQTLSVEGLPEVYAMIQGNLLLGSASLVPHDLPDEPDWTPWLASVYVAAPFRGRGLGKQLVRFMEDRAQSQGYESLYLFTESAASFYIQQGYTALQTRIHRTVPITVMKRSLSQNSVTGG